MTAEQENRRAFGQRDFLVRGALVATLVSVACTADPYVSVANWNLSTADGKSSPIHAPQRFNDLLPGHPATYWLDADVALPPSLRGRPLTLTWADTQALATLSVDGQSILPMSLLPFDRVRPSRRELVFRLPDTVTKRTAVHLRLGVHHVDTYTGRIGRAPRLAAGLTGEHQLHVAADVNYAIVVGTVAVIALLAFASGAAFLIDRRRVAAGWYSLMNLGIVTSGLTGLGLAQLVVSSDVRRAPLVAVPLVCVSGAAFTYAQFRLKLPRRIWIAVALLGAVALVLGWPAFASPRRYFLFLLLELTWVAAYQAPTIARLVRKPEWRWQAVGNLGALAALAGGVALEIPAHLIDVFPLACLVCTSALGLMLLRAHTTGLHALNVTLESHISLLEERNQEVRQLNEELRLQAHHRAEALARLERLSSQSEPAPAIGTVLGARYRILAALWRDRDGAVYEVERILDGRRLTLKALGRAREARFPSIAHPNVVGVLDMDIDASGLPYVVMDLVKGELLTAEQARFGDATFAHEVVRQAARGLAALHDAGIVHGNLTPAKVLLERRADDTFCVKIVDFGFGVRRPAGKPAGVLATDGFIPFVLGDTSEEIDRGALVYAAPELSIDAQEAGPASDVWSLGVVAHQLGCGRLPCLDPVELGALTGPLRRVVEGCLELDPRRRPSAAEVVVALA